MHEWKRWDKVDEIWCNCLKVISFYDAVLIFIMTSVIEYASVCYGNKQNMWQSFCYVYQEVQQINKSGAQW